MTRASLRPMFGAPAMFVAMLAACGGNRLPAPGETQTVRIDNVRSSLTALAHDSMRGRRTGTPGAAKAASFIAAEMLAIGLEPAGDDGFLQRVPLARATVRTERQGQAPQEREVLQLRIGPGALDTVPPERRVLDANVIGVIRGRDASLRDEAIVVGAHYDHVGVGAPVNGDSIRNGADDDASGVVAVLEIARALKSGTPPRRTVVFVAFTGEEMGGFGSRLYLAQPTVPLERTVAQLQIEMIGRPDSLAGGPGRGWLTGYERSTMGDMLKDNGIPIVADPRPEQNFFQRSDNYAFARRGIPAHTLSSYNMHADYHQPSDEVDGIDLAHMTEVISAAARAVTILANGAAPRWHPGGQPPGSDPPEN